MISLNVVIIYSRCVKFECGQLISFPMIKVFRDGKRTNK